MLRRKGSGVIVAGSEKSGSHHGSWKFEAFDASTGADMVSGQYRP